MRYGQFKISNNLPLHVQLIGGHDHQIR